MIRSDSIKQLAAALVKAQKAMPNAVINSDNPHFRSRYADLASVREAVIGPLNDNGIVVAQVPTFDIATGAFVLETKLVHSTSGEFIRGDFPLPTNVRPQEIGSAITYARRFSIAAMTFIAAVEDDDGNEAEQIPVKMVQRAPPKAANDNKPAEKLEPQALAFNEQEDCVEWGSRLAAQLNLAKTAEEVGDWMRRNEGALAAVATRAPKVFARLQSLANQKHSPPKVDQPNKTGARTTGPAKSAADDLESFRTLMLEAKSERELNETWNNYKLNQSDLDRAVEMYETRLKQLKLAA